MSGSNALAVWLCDPNMQRAIRFVIMMIMHSHIHVVHWQLENMLGGEQVYEARVTKHLVPCVAQFSVAMGDDSQWKVLNYQILLKTRHSSPKVTAAKIAEQSLLSHCYI